MATPAHCTEELDIAGWKCRNGSTRPLRITSTPQRKGGPAVARIQAASHDSLRASGTSEEDISPPESAAASVADRDQQSARPLREPDCPVTKIGRFAQIRFFWTASLPPPQ